MPKTAARDIHGRYQYDVIMYLFSGLVNNKGADQPAHPHSLISAFAFRSFETIISRLSVIKETGLSLALSNTEDRFILRRGLNLLFSVLASILIPSSIFFWMF